VTADATVADVLAGAARFFIAHEDALTFARSLPDASVDSIVTDPPAGIGFMSKAWDGDKGGRDSWVAWLREILAECHRALKPGGHALVWALPRTSHWTATAVEDAGFEVRDVVMHLYGSGFPKSLNVSKALDKSAGAEREVVAPDPQSAKRNKTSAQFGGPAMGKYDPGYDGPLGRMGVTAPSTDLAKQWDGWGTALKPASEHWILARKPLIGTVAANVAAHGTGCLNIDACRIGTDSTRRDTGSAAMWSNAGRIVGGSDAGRWPANVVLSHLDTCREIGTRTVKRNLLDARARTTPSQFGAMGGSRSLGTVDETVPAWACAEGCAVAALDAQSGERATSQPGQVFRRTTVAANVYGDHAADVGAEQVAYGDTGGASRFFFCAKPSTAERESGLGHRKRGPSRGAMNTKNGTGERLDGAPTAQRANVHPTVKSVALMRWLCRLVTPPGGVVLDVFTGSGTTAVACSQEGLRFLGCEREAEYVAIARDRLFGDAPLFNATGAK